MSDFGKISVEAIRGRLQTLVGQINGVGSGATTGYWVGDAAAERQVQDDLESGRLFWSTALRRAESGLKALDNDNPDFALIYLLEAHQLAIDALGLRLSRVRDQEGLKLLAKPAKPRGRKKKIAQTE